MVSQKLHIEWQDMSHEPYIVATRSVDYQCNSNAAEESYERVMDWNRAGTGTKTD